MKNKALNNAELTDGGKKSQTRKSNRNSHNHADSERAGIVGLPSLL